MATIIVVIGLLNFVLGYGLALALADPPFLGLQSRLDWRLAWQGVSARMAALKRPTAAASELEPASPPPILEATRPLTLALDSDLPDSWQQMLRDQGLRLNSLAVGVAHLARLEGADYREHLLATECRARQALKEQNVLGAEQLAADLRFINGDWASKLRQAAELVEDSEGRHGAVENVAARLARFLSDQAEQVAEIDRGIHALSFRTEGAAACRRLVSDLHQLLRLAHVQRDETLDLLAALLKGEGKLSQLDENLHGDPGTGLLCKLDLEVLFSQEFVEGTRPTAAMLISLDRLDKVNQKLGARGGDGVLKSFSELLAELAAERFAASFIARRQSDQFLVWVQEPSLEALASAGEHFRQSLEAANFHFQGAELSLTASISVAAVAAEEGLDEILNKLDAGLALARKGGQNRSACWENGAASLILPPAIPITAREIRMELTAA